MTRSPDIAVSNTYFIALFCLATLGLTVLELGYWSTFVSPLASLATREGATLLFTLAIGNTFLFWILFGRERNKTTPQANTPLLPETPEGAYRAHSLTTKANPEDIDILTGLLNRTRLSTDFNSLVTQASSSIPPTFAYMIADCDHFCAINTTYGQGVGDSVIRGIAGVLSRACQATPGATCYRVSADEFAILVPDLFAEEAREWAQNIAEQCFYIDAGYTLLEEPISVSIGLSCTQIAGASEIASLPVQASAALRRAKQVGNVKAALFDPKQDAEGLALFSNPLQHAVLDALADIHKIAMVYQPVVNSVNHNVDYYEALARIKYNAANLIPPSLFLPIIAFKRLEVEFDLAVIQAIKADIVANVIPSNAGLSINISSPGLLSTRIHSELLSLRQLAGSRCLILEVTESVLIRDMPEACRCLELLRGYGFLSALDDFGSGFSSLLYLHKLPLDIIKFDRALVLSLCDQNSAIVEAVAHATCTAGFKLVAEGIETQAQLDRVTKVGFTHVQGFFFGKPSRIFTAKRAVAC